MTLPGVTQRRPELGALPNPAGQRGPSALAASGAPAGCAPGPRPAPGPRTLIFVLGTLLLGPAASAVIIRQERVHQQLAAPQMSTKCPAGYHVSEDSRSCTPCTDGVDYTSHKNLFSSCLPCSTCKSDEERIADCTRTEDTQCRCKRGTFHGEDFPEVCQTCRSRCPDGMVEASPCTPWSDLKCVHQGSGNPWPVIGIVVGPVAVLLLGLTVYLCRRRILQGCEVAANCINRVFFLRSCPPRRPEALDNAYNETLNNRESSSTLVSEQELEGKEQAEPTGVSAQSQGEAERLLGPAGAEGSQMRRRLLVPANGADPTESLQLFFDYFPRIVPFKSWKRLMRQLGLTQNEIDVTEAEITSHQDALYEMLTIWLKKTGRSASVNTLLDALETLGEKYAKETIQDHLLASGKYVYEEDGAGSAVS
ncbi:tumor necrosis factor receptor superfamily member 10A-like isoform X2 [Equus asinus]|uniref:tumor necrosis factor receptor superfamily member 10A-like isoform X2 n=1 Tax=Equus asinus TaxID=9793 RepID=UPI001D044AA6|nr:tumor necrosis factor receptor superfamily member 10A-like isoform X2 [Equus asinus]